MCWRRMRGCDAIEKVVFLINQFSVLEMVVQNKAVLCFLEGSLLVKSLLCIRHVGVE